MARHRSLVAAMHPDVVTCAVAHEPSAVAAEPALELAALHSDDVAVAAATKALTQLPKGLDDPRLYRERGSLGDRRHVVEVVQRLEHVDPGLVPRAALGDRCGNLEDLGGDPAIVVLGVADGQVTRLDRANLWVCSRAHRQEASTLGTVIRRSSRQEREAVNTPVNPGQRGGVDREDRRLSVKVTPRSLSRRVGSPKSSVWPG